MEVTGAVQGRRVCCTPQERDERERLHRVDAVMAALQRCCSAAPLCVMPVLTTAQLAVQPLCEKGTLSTLADTEGSAPH